jgi:hypothetical protein
LAARVCQVENRETPMPKGDGAIDVCPGAIGTTMRDRVGHTTCDSHVARTPVEIDHSRESAHALLPLPFAEVGIALLRIDSRGGVALLGHSLEYH